MRYLTADTTNGCEEINFTEEESFERFSSVEDVLSRLRYLTYDEMLFMELTEEQYEAVESEYGIWG